MNTYNIDKMYESYSSEVERMQKCIDELQQENQELKLELSGYRQAILKDKEMLGLKEENDKLKKQLEEYKATNKILSHELTKDKVLQQDCLTTCCGIPIGDIPKLITQQKEFIEYLEKRYKDITSVIGSYGSNTDMLYVKKDMIEEILSKYKEIIGGKDERYKYKL